MIAIIIASSVDSYIGLNTDKLLIPHEFKVRLIYFTYKIKFTVTIILILIINSQHHLIEDG